MGYYDPPDDPLEPVNPDQADDDIPASLCPKCGAEQVDFDGFGVLKCEACDYCSHASVDGGVCGLCGAVQVP